MNVNIFHNNITEYLYYSTFLHLKLSVQAKNKKETGQGGIYIFYEISD